MKKVENMNGYKFDSCKYFRIQKDKASAKLENMSKLLDEKISKMESRLRELKEARDFINTGNQIYLIKSNDSDYGYVDNKGKNYEYKEINGKPILIDSVFNLYEIVEYVELDDIGQDKGSRYYTTTWIDKVVKVKPIEKSC